MRPAGRRRDTLDRAVARLWTRLDVIFYRWFRRSIGARALGLDDVLLLRTRGRRSGQVREVLVAYVELGGAPVICGANAGSDANPGWFKNLEAGSPVEIERHPHPHRLSVTPVLLEGAERSQALQAVVEAFPHVKLYAAHTSRPFPLVRLDLVDRSVPARVVVPVGCHRDPAAAS